MRRCDWPTPCAIRWTAHYAARVTLEAHVDRCPARATRQHQMLWYCATHSPIVSENRRALISNLRTAAPLELPNWRDELFPPGGRWTPVKTVDTGELL